MQMKLSPSDCRALMRRDLYAFIERSFYELNPTATFMPNWHIEVIASALEACRRGEDALSHQRTAAQFEVALRLGGFCRFPLGSRPDCQNYLRELRPRLGKQTRDGLSHNLE